jgi:sigma-B regulation protein RsbU (phosphoserine phosphatase)
MSKISGIRNDSLKSGRFIEDIINGMYDWVRVLDRNDNIIYANRAMSDGLGCMPVGLKCYEVLGRKEPCENCISRKAVFDGHSHEKEESIGEKTFSVMSSPIRNSQGEVIAVVEVLRDITQMKFMQKEIMEQNLKLQSDLALARKLQCSLLPKNLPEDRIKFSFIYKPCEAIGGDFLDIFRIDEKNIGLYVADVSGHGVSASMLTVFLRSSINRKTLSPALTLRQLYSDFNANDFDHHIYITVFYAVINIETLTITYSNAGHNVPPIIFGGDRFDLLRIPGTPISSWMDNPEYIEGQTQLQSGEKLFLYTDGIIETRNRDNEQFGEERLLSLLLDSSCDSSATLNRIVDSVCAFSGLEGSKDLPDDITMALLEVIE